VRTVPLSASLHNSLSRKVEKVKDDIAVCECLLHGYKRLIGGWYELTVAFSIVMELATLQK
jgi:hypothetical protein